MVAHAPTRRPLRAPRAPPGTLLSHLNALQGSLLPRPTVGGTHSPKRPRVIGPRRKIRLADLGLDGVTQTILGRGPEFGEPTSNGMQAALATVFGLPLDAVPHFPDTEPNAGWWDRMNAWLAEHYGVALVSCTAGAWEVPRVLHLTQGNTVRDVPHVVVAFGGQLLTTRTRAELGSPRCCRTNSFSRSTPVAWMP